MGREGLTIIVGGGDAPVGRRLPRADFVVAADAGLDRALQLGIGVDVVVGDFDSVSADALEAARQSGVEIEHHPAAKDKTDLELALDRALGLPARRVLVVAVDGGRTDHALANLLLLASDRYAGLDVEAWTVDATISVVRRRREFEWNEGDTVSLLPVGGDAHGITTTGLVYPLRDESLSSGSSRGVSNVVAQRAVVVEVDRGTLLAIHLER